MEYILNKIDLNARDKIEKATKIDKVRAKRKISSIKKYNQDEKSDGNKKFSLNKKESKNIKFVVTAKKEKKAATINVQGFRKEEDNTNIGIGSYLDIRK